MHYLKQNGEIMIKLKEILFLKNLKGIGKATIYKKYWNLLKDCDDFYDLVSEVELNSKFSTEEIKKAMDNAERLYDNILNSEIEVITVFDEKYPEKLNVMGNKRPVILYVMGDADALTKANIGIIGTRKPSKSSQNFERDLVKNIVNTSNRVVVSGLAFGCDKIAHKTTVDENKITIAVLPSGVNKISPASNKNLAEKIIKTGGCLISEYESETKVRRGNYVERDRIVAAFSDVVFVVECGVESGTMHTVNFAKEYKKQIYSYLPDERPEGFYDGNEFILQNNRDALKVGNIEEFLEDLETLKIKKSTKSGQQTLF